MEFYFKRMDFNDPTSLTNYGIEVLEELSQINRNDRNLINVNMRNEELNRLIKEISNFSIDNEIDKKVDESTPLTIGLLEKVLNSKFVNNKYTPSFIKNKIIKPVEEMKSENSQPVNSVDLYNHIMNVIDNIGIELQNNYNETQAVVETLNYSKEEINNLISKFDMVINIGIEDLEIYKNSDTEDPLKSKKIEFVTTRIAFLKGTKAELSVSLQKKDLKIFNLGIEVQNVQMWMYNEYPKLAEQVEDSIETKYISNRVDTFKQLNDASKKIYLDSAEVLKETTQKNIEMLKEGGIDTKALDKYIKTVQAAILPVKSYFDNKENITKKLISDIDKIESEIEKGNTILNLIQTENTTPSIEEPKTLKLEMNKSNNE